jgi:hypothetical protein
MIRTIALFLLLSSFQQDFTRFTFCRETPGGSFDSVCILLNPAGSGEAQFKRREGEDFKFAIMLSPSGNNEFLRVLSGTKYLANAKSYESRKKVADLGKKHLILEMASGRREANFNYSDMKDVTALVTFFEKLVIHEALVVDLGWAMQFDRLGVPDRLDQMEKILKDGRSADPKSLMDVLDMVDQDQRIVNYARSHARELKQKIATAK